MEIFRERLYGTPGMKARQAKRAMQDMEQLLATLPETEDTSDQLLQRSRQRGHSDPLSRFGSEPSRRLAMLDDGLTDRPQQSAPDSQESDYYRDTEETDFDDYSDPEPINGDKPFLSTRSAVIMSIVCVGGIALAARPNEVVSNFVHGLLGNKEAVDPQIFDGGAVGPAEELPGPAWYGPPDASRTITIPSDFAR